MFLHAGFLHVVPNLMVQCWFGCLVELRWGAPFSALVYVFSGLGGGLCSVALSKPNQLSVGCSGALHGGMAAAIFAQIGGSRHPLRDYGPAAVFDWRVSALSL